MADKNKNTFLVAVDFTSFSEQALLFAADLADKISADILILHVIHDPLEAPGFYAAKGKKKKFLTSMEDSANEMMEDFLKKVRKNNKTLNSLKNAECLLVVGTPVTRIIEIAKKNRVKMIFVGSHGRTGLSHMLVGSKAERVVQLSTVPVVVVKNPSAK